MFRTALAALLALAAPAVAADAQLVVELVGRGRIAAQLPLDVLDAARPASDPRPPGTEAEVGQRVGAALGALPSPQREACSLRLLGELTLEEIAAVTGASLGTVKSRLFYGQRRLRELLADMNPRGGAT